MARWSAHIIGEHSAKKCDLFAKPPLPDAGTAILAPARRLCEARIPGNVVEEGLAVNSCLRPRAPPDPNPEPFELLPRD